MLAFYREYPYLEISPQAVAEIPTGLFFCRAMGPPRSVAQQDQGSPHACLVHASFRRERLEQGGAALGNPVKDSMAAKLKPADVSLEQMMVGLYRNNSGAFAGDMNKLRAGATLDVPAADGVRSIPPRDALDTVRAQVKDWRNYVLGGADAAAAAPARDPGKTRTPPSDASAEVAPQDNKEGVLKLSKADGPIWATV